MMCATHMRVVDIPTRQYIFEGIAVSAPCLYGGRVGGFILEGMGQIDPPLQMPSSRFSFRGCYGRAKHPYPFTFADLPLFFYPIFPM
jgi:hypothetical protein